LPKNNNVLYNNMIHTVHLYNGNKYMKRLLSTVKNTMDSPSCEERSGGGGLMPWVKPVGGDKKPTGL
jgi:hypothetical protein